jgi:hypothetical protein
MAKMQQLMEQRKIGLNTKASNRPIMSEIKEKRLVSNKKTAV